MATKGDDGVPLRQHLEKDAEGMFANPASQAKLDAAPPQPPNTARVWGIFLELHQRRPQGEFGPMRLPWTEVEAFQRVTSVPLRNWERQAIFALEDTFFEVRAENEAKKPKKT